MTVLISEIFHTKSEMQRAKKQLKENIYEMFGLEPQEVRLPHDLIILQRKISSEKWVGITSRITSFPENMENKNVDYRLKTRDLILKN